MTPAQLDDVRKASQRERAHHADNVRLGAQPPECYCRRCKMDRETIATAMPELLEIVDRARNEPRRAGGDTWDYDS